MLVGVVVVVVVGKQRPRTEGGALMRWRWLDDASSGSSVRLALMGRMVMREEERQRAVICGPA